MKYSIFGYSQSELLKYSIDAVDLMLLDHLVFITMSKELESVIIDDDRYVWITPTMIANDLPFLNLKERGVEARINNLVDNGMVEKKQKWTDNDGRQKKSYLKVSQRTLSLLYQCEGEDYTPNKEKLNKTKENDLKNEIDNIPYGEIVKYLNEQTGHNFNEKTNATRRLIKSRWNEGHTLEDFKKVIYVKCSQWKNDIKMSKYLKPDTLFAPTHFDNYLQEYKGKEKEKDNLFTVI